MSPPIQASGRDSPVGRATALEVDYQRHRRPRWLEPALRTRRPSCSDPYSGRYRSGRSRGSGTRRESRMHASHDKSCGSPGRRAAEQQPERAPLPRLRPRRCGSFETGEQQRAARLSDQSPRFNVLPGSMCAVPPSAKPLSSRARTWTPKSRQLHRASRDSGQVGRLPLPEGQQSIPLEFARRCSSARAPVCDQARPQALLTDSPGCAADAGRAHHRDDLLHPLLDAAGRRRSPATLPGYRRGARRGSVRWW